MHNLGLKRENEVIYSNNIGGFYKFINNSYLVKVALEPYRRPAENLALVTLIVQI
jgi:hypothetical protein